MIKGILNLIWVIFCLYLIINGTITEGFKELLIGTFIAIFISLFYFILQDKSNRNNYRSHGPTIENKSDEDDDGEE